MPSSDDYSARELAEKIELTKQLLTGRQTALQAQKDAYNVFVSASTLPEESKRLQENFFKSEIERLELEVIDLMDQLGKFWSSQALDNRKEH